MTSRTVPAIIRAPSHSGERDCDVMTECAIHTIALPEGHFACIIGSSPITGKASIQILDAEEVEVHIQFLRNAIEDAQRLDRGMAVRHASPSLRRN
jgi:hypothetical protein